MQRKASIKILTLLILIVIAFASILFSLPEINETAYAVLPESYITAVKDQNKDWQNGENYLNVSKIKNIVASLKSDYSERLSDIEQSPIVVAVIDTGILATHDMFTGKYDENGKRKESVSVGEYDVLLRDKDGNIIGRNCVADNNDLSDIGYHGTHVAGIIAYYIHEFDLEKYIKIMPIKAATVSGESYSFDGNDFKKAINFALGADEHGISIDGAAKADVVNMSLTAAETKGSNTAFNLDNFKIKNKVVDVTSQAVFVAAAGNDGEYSGNNRVGYPAASDGVIGVMNYQQSGTGGIDLYQNSGIVSTNFGDVYDFAAPGGSILNADAEHASGDKYRAASGTSMSSPVVSFGAALRIFYERLQKGEYDVVEIRDVLTTAKYKTVTKDSPFKFKPVKALLGGYTWSTMSSSYTYKVFDFESILASVEFAEILLDGDLTQTVDSVTAISFKFRAAGDRFNGGTVDWYVNDVLKRENSRELTFTPENAVGKVTVRAVWKSGSDTHEISKEINVNYIPLDETTVSRLEIKATEGGEAVTDYSRITLGSTLTFYVSSGKIEPAADDKILWYVDDKYVGVGKSYSYLATRSGDHTVKVKINNLEAPVATFSVISEMQVKEKETRRILGIVSIAVGIGIGVSLIVLFAVVLDGKRKKKSKR